MPFDSAPADSEEFSGIFQLGNVINDVAVSVPHDCVPAEVSADLQQQRLCLATVARAAAVELSEAMPGAFPASVRSQLFSLFSEWSMDASPGMKSGTSPAAQK